MPALLVWCYAGGVFSSRRLERAADRDIGARFIAAHTHPDHDTIARFHRTNKAAADAADGDPQALPAEIARRDALNQKRDAACARPAAEEGTGQGRKGQSTKRRKRPMRPRRNGAAGRPSHPTGRRRRTGRPTSPTPVRS